MFSYLLKRLLVMAVTLFGIILMTFLISRLTPSDPAMLAVAQEGAFRTEGLSDISIRETRRAMGLDRPLLINLRFEDRKWAARDALSRYLANPPGFWRDTARFELGEINTLAVFEALEALSGETDPGRRAALLEALPLLARVPAERVNDLPTSAALAFWSQWGSENRERLGDAAVREAVEEWLATGAPEAERAVALAGGRAIAWLIPEIFGKDPARRDRALLAAQGCANKPSSWSDVSSPGATRETLHRWKSWWRRVHLRFTEPAPLARAAHVVTQTQFGVWFLQFITFDFGVSTRDNRPVMDILLERLPVTLQLSILSIFFTYLLAIPLGVFSATHEGSWMDRLLTLLLFLLYSLPVFWLAQILILTLSEHFPTRGLSSLEARWGAADWPWHRWLLDRLWHLALPVVSQTVVALAFLSRQMRVALLETIRQDFIRTARAKGLSEFKVVYKHAMRNSLIPILTLAAELLPALIGGSVIIESIFSLNGMGKLTFEAILNRNYPVINCVFAFSALLTLSGILLADLGYSLVDPRIRLDRR